MVLSKLPRLALVLLFAFSHDVHNGEALADRFMVAVSFGASCDTYLMLSVILPRFEIGASRSTETRRAMNPV